MELSNVQLEFPDGANIILGHSHFIKTVEDLYEIMATTVGGSKFGIAFCEASQECLIRYDGNDEAMKEVAVTNAQKIGAGHSFVIVMQDAFPISVLNAVKSCQEVCRIICATANPVQVLITETEQGRGIVGVIDGFSPKGVENQENMDYRKEFLRKINYKR